MPRHHELLIDGFCGAGFFAKALVGKFNRVVGIEWDRFAIAAALETAGAKETYIAGDVDANLKSILGECDADKTQVIVDPPAVGLSAKLPKKIVDLSPATLIFVSVNSTPPSRDLTQLPLRIQIRY